MKIGDKIYCIKSYGKSLNYCQFVEGQSYIIKSIFYVAKKIYVERVGRDGGKYSTGFNINNCDEIGWDNFTDHFISVKQQRKQKLDKINRTR